MTNELFISRPVSQLPKEEGWYRVINETNKYYLAVIYFNGKEWSELTTAVYTHWLSEPITIESLLAEHPEVVEKIFEAARVMDGNPKDSYHPRYFTAQDYINSLKQKP